MRSCDGMGPAGRGCPPTMLQGVLDAAARPDARRPSSRLGGHRHQRQDLGRDGDAAAAARGGAACGRLRLDGDHRRARRPAARGIPPLGAVPAGPDRRAGRARGGGDLARGLRRDPEGRPAHAGRGRRGGVHGTGAGPSRRARQPRAVLGREAAAVRGASAPRRGGGARCRLRAGRSGAGRCRTAWGAARHRGPGRGRRARRRPRARRAAAPGPAAGGGGTARRGAADGARRRGDESAARRERGDRPGRRARSGGRGAVRGGSGPTPVPWTRGLFTLRARVYRSRRVRRRSGAGSGTRSGGAWCCSGSASGTSFDGRTARR